MNLTHINRHSVKTDVTLVGRRLTISRVVDGQLLTLNRTFRSDTTINTFQKIVSNACELDNQTFESAAEYSMDEGIE